MQNITEEEYEQFKIEFGTTKDVSNHERLVKNIQSYRCCTIC